MKQQKFRRYKGRVFYRSRKRYLPVLLCLAAVGLLIGSGFWMAKTVLANPSVSTSASSLSSSTIATTVPSSTAVTTATTTVTTLTTTSTQPSSAVTGEQIAALAKTLVDKPFVSGGAGPDAFDNYGLVYYCLKSFDIPEASRYISKLLQNGTPIAHSEWKPGDVVFFSNEIEQTTPNYMGIYLGDGKFIAANNPDKPSCIYNINSPYFSKRYRDARRFTD